MVRARVPSPARPPLPHPLGIALLLLGLPGAAVAEGPSERPLLFLGNENIAPVVYRDNGTPAGVAVDITRALGRHLPRPIEIRAMAWPEAQALVARGEADVLVQINPTEERRAVYDFSDTLLESQFSIFTQADRVGISGISSLRGLRVGVEQGGLPRLLLEKSPRIHLTVIPDFREGFQKLEERTLDAIVVDYRVGSWVIARNGLRGVKVAGEPIAFSYSAFAVKKGNAALLVAIDQALKAIKDDGTYQRILDAWRPQEVVFRTREQIERQITYGTIVGLLFLLLIAAAWTLTLRRELARRRAVEQRLEEQVSTLRSIIDSANAIVFSVDRHYRYTSYNQAHATVMKAIYGAEIGLGLDMLELMTVPGDREIARRNLDRALAGERLVEEAYSGEELRSRQYFQVSHSPVEAAGQVIGVAVLAHDLTARKQAEEEVRNLNQGLEKRVAERTAEVEAANRDLEGFAYSVSHDLRAPLRHIDGYLGLLARRIGPALDEESRHYVAAVSDAALRMSALIDDLLTFSRMGRKELIRAQVDLADLVHEVIRDLQPETKGRAVRWSIGELPHVAGDRAMLRIALTNLVGNAVKFTRTRPQADIEIGTRPGGPAEVVVFVRDNGVGFDMTYVDKLFGVFQRLHRLEEFKGTGIGLANVRQVISRHGGKTWAEGKVDGGATFYFSLPLA